MITMLQITGGVRLSCLLFANKPTEDTMNTNYTLEQELIDREQLQADYDRCRETGEAELCWNCRELTMMEELDRNYGVCDECK
jgi:hypothetical protein